MRPPGGTRGRFRKNSAPSFFGRVVVAVKFLLDADLPRALLTALLREEPTLDVLRVEQAGLRTAPDPDILAFAAEEGRILVTKDKATMLDHAASRLSRGERMCGLVIIRPAFLRGLRGLGARPGTRAAGARAW